MHSFFGVLIVVVKWIVQGLWWVMDLARRVLHLILLVAIFSVVGLVITYTDNPLPDRAALVLSLQGELIEEVSEDPVSLVLAEFTEAPVTQTDMPTLRRAVEYAVDDERVTTVVLEVQSLMSADLANQTEILGLVRKLQDAGKTVVSYADYFDQTQYLIAAGVDEIYMHPSGFIALQGYGAYHQYYKEAIDRLKINWHVFKVGEYKSFVEPFTRNSMSDADRRSTRVWLDQLWSTYLSTAAHARDLGEKSLPEYIANLTDLSDRYQGDYAKLALELDLVDELITRTEFNKRMVERVGMDDLSHQFNYVTHREYVRKRSDELGSKDDAKPAVGVIVASGAIMDGYHSDGVIGDLNLIPKIREAQGDGDIRALVLRVDSPGGSKLASEHILAALDEFQATGKPLLVSMGGVAASGGYWISMGADQIFADPGTLTGSIGIGAMFPTFDRSLAHLGIYTDGLGTTELAGTMRLDRPLTPAAEKLIQASVDHGYEQFVTAVSEARDMDLGRVKELAQGRVWTGADAQKNGLVDQLGGFDAAVAAAADAAGLDNYRIEYVVDYADWRSIVSAQFIRIAAQISPGLGLMEASLLGDAARLLNKIDTQVKTLMSIKDPQRLYAWCWCDVG